MLIFGVHDQERTAGHNRVNPNLDKLQLSLILARNYLVRRVHKFCACPDEAQLKENHRRQQYSGMELGRKKHEKNKQGGGGQGDRHPQC
jgi:hypothetical protein